MVGYCRKGDEVIRGGACGCGGGFFLTVADNDLGVLRQTEVSSVVVDATHPSFTGIWQCRTLVDVWEMESTDRELKLQSELYLSLSALSQFISDFIILTFLDMIRHFKLELTK